MRIKTKIIHFNAIISIFTLSACGKFLDIVPDNSADMDMTFNLRTTAERYLFTCYSFMPIQGDVTGYRNNNPSFLAGNEFTYSASAFANGGPFRIAFGNQNITSPFSNFWSYGLFTGIRECNNFIENIDKVPDLTEDEKKRWIAEVKFLKAYYHFFLFRQYGPIPIIDKNLPLSTPSEDVLVYRRPIDEIVDYMVNLLDEAYLDLPDKITSRTDELGRIDKCIALSLKAQILVIAASPLYNGNQDYQNFKSPAGYLYFNQTYNQEKWTRAALATKTAIDFLENNGYQLYYFDISNENAPNNNINSTTLTELNIRGAITKKWNQEVVWSNPKSRFDAYDIGEFMPKLDATLQGSYTDGSAAPTLNVALSFYTKNGVPIDEDREWDYSKRFDLRVATTADDQLIAAGYTTAYLHFDREPRFYASLGFDGGRWYGQNNYDDKNSWIIRGKKGQAGFSTNTTNFSMTGYYAKKLVHYETTTLQSSIQIKEYSWPVIRLADLYLLQAEAANEAYGPSEDVYKYLDLVRKRAGLEGVISSWQKYSKIPNKPLSKDGLREIIRAERKIELALEGQRFWDQLRWKTAIEELNAPILGWDYTQSNTAAYYRVISHVNRSFGIKDYLWPIPQNAILQNKNLGQNYGW